MEVRFTITAGLIAGAVVIALAVAYWLATYSLPQLAVFVAASAAAAAAIVSAFYSGRGLRQAAEAIEIQEETRRKALALHLISRWNDPAMYHVRDVVREVFKTDHNSPGFQQRLTDKETNVIHFLNFLEEVALGLEQAGADEAILRSAFSGVVSTAWTKLENYVREQRRARGRPLIWTKVEELARSWAQ